MELFFKDQLDVDVGSATEECVEVDQIKDHHAHKHEVSTCIYARIHTDVHA